MDYGRAAVAELVVAGAGLFLLTGCSRFGLDFTMTTSSFCGLPVASTTSLEAFTLSPLPLSTYSEANKVNFFRFFSFAIAPLSRLSSSRLLRESSSF